MHSVLEQEVRRLVFRFRAWVVVRDRAVVFGALLCCVPFLPVTAVGVLISLGNLLLWRLGKLPSSEVPVLIAALLLASLWVVLWWLAFTAMLGSPFWHMVGQFWRGVWDIIWWLRPYGTWRDV